MDEWVFDTCYHADEEPGFPNDWSTSNNNGTYELHTDVPGATSSILINQNVFIHSFVDYRTEWGATVEFRGKVRQAEDQADAAYVAIEGPNEGATGPGGSLRFTNTSVVIGGANEVASTGTFDPTQWHVYRMLVAEASGGVSVYVDDETTPLVSVDSLDPDPILVYEFGGMGAVMFGAFAVRGKAAVWDLDWICASAFGPFPVIDDGWWYPGDPIPSGTNTPTPTPDGATPTATPNEALLPLNPPRLLALIKDWHDGNVTQEYLFDRCRTWYVPD
jgi:hypothetical protein